MQIESAGDNADGIVQVIKTQLEITLAEAQELAKKLPALVKGGNYLNARSVVKAFKNAGAEAKIKYYPAWESPLGKEETKKDANGKKVKVPDSDMKHEIGAVEFTQEDTDVVKKQTGANAKAYAKLAEAMQIGWDNFYPETKEETERMDALLDESEKAATGITDPEYYKVLKEMRGIVAGRHFNFSWLIIFGSLIFISAVVYLGNDKRGYKKIAKARVDQDHTWWEKRTLTTTRRAGS